jgi:hypothetical protein
MSHASSILVLSACTATKATEGNERAVLAEELYAGQQHRRLMRGVNTYRAAAQRGGPLDLHILSAAHGVVAWHEPLRSYNATFTGMRRAQLRRRAARLGIPAAVAQLLRTRRRLAMLLLGDDYLQAARLSSVVELGAPTLVFTSPDSATRLPTMPRLHPVPLDNGDARRFSCGLVALKGELAARLLIRTAQSPKAEAPLDRAGLLAWLEGDPEARSVRPLDQDLTEVA